MTYGRSVFAVLQLIVIGYFAGFPRLVYSSYNIALRKPASQSTPYGDWGPGKAVDGTIGKDVEPNGGGSCSTTNPTGSREAWWKVDLQVISRIKSINVTYRQLYPFRLSGFYLYVSNVTAVDNLPNTAHLCYHDDTKDPDLPSFNQSRSCSVDGRYVIFDNIRPADNGPKSHQYYSTTDAVVELCEVQVIGCPIKHYGLGNCDRKCHCGVGGCDPDIGLCDVTGCQSGWMGPTCSEECKGEMFGMNCNQRCHCSTPGCDRETGSCTVPGCEAGWQGNACDEACGANRFGKNCLQTCHCDLPGCDRFNGSCTPPGCEPGWKGIACDKVCTIDHFGKDCKQTCHCAIPGCDRSSGLCNRTGCGAGWEGQTCGKACDIGRYGQDCKYTCKCATPGCDAITGNCTVQGCEVGWQGSTCNTACNTTSYGSNCNTICHCATPGCDRFTGLCNVTGCDVGWKGSSCDQAYVQNTENSQDDLPLAGIIGGASAFLVAVIVIVIFTVILIRRKRNTPSKRNDRVSRKQKAITLIIDRKKDDTIYVNMASIEAELSVGDTDTHGEPQEDTKDDMDADEDEVIYVNNPLRPPVVKDTKMNVKDLHDIITRKNKDEAFDNEYQNLPHGLVHPHEISRATENIIRNRFKTTFAYDHSRVILRKEKEGLSDYINANHIEDTQGIKAYIAAQGPKVTTLEDFWRMVWQKQSGKIIMLANLVELGKKKCTKYWEGEESNSLQLGLYHVTLQEEMSYAFYTIRKLSVRNKQTNAKRQITQYHFTKWPDHGVPEAFELLQFHKRVQSTQTDLKGPLIVHCSAGIGRTGTYIGLDALLKDGNERDEIDVFDYTKRMRKDRMNMIQTLDQYVVLHKVLAEGLGVVTTCPTGSDFSKSISGNLAEGIVKKQFNVLANHKPLYKDKDIAIALTSTNKRKNKDLAILAVEKYRVYLTSPTSNYINAIDVPSYRDQHGYIITQHPLHNTVEDFWSMVSQQAVDVIVSIGTPQGNAGWLTKEGSVGDYGDFTVTYVENQSQESLPEMTKRKLSIQNKKTTTATVVTVLETSSWNGTLPSTKLMLELIQQVLNLKRSVTSPVIITCSNGSTDSGLLCVLCNAMERLEVDGEVDIMSAARQLQIRRPQCLPNMAQYEFCYKVMKDHMDKGSVYANI